MVYVCVCVFMPLIGHVAVHVCLDFGLWSGTEHTKRNDRLCSYEVVPCTGDNAELDALQSDR